MIGYILTRSQIDPQKGFSHFHFSEVIESKNADGLPRVEGRDCVVIAHEVEYHVDSISIQGNQLHELSGDFIRELFEESTGLTRIEFQKLKIKPYEKD